MLLGSPQLRNELDHFSHTYRLTPRERDVLLLLVSGVGTVPDISARMSLSGNTIHNHFKNIFRRTQTNTKTALLALFLNEVLARQAAAVTLLRRPRVLLVETDGAERTRLSDGLFGHGFDAMGETSAAAVAARVASDRIDVVVASTDGGAGQALRDELQARFGARPGVVLCGKSSTDGDLLRAPVALDVLCFAILDRLAATPYERSRLVRVDAQIPVRLGDGGEAETLNVGFGGAFVALDGAPAAVAARYPVGSRTVVSVALDDDRPLKLDAEVRWHRHSSRPGDTQGLGLRFVELATEHQRKVEDFVRRRKVESLLRHAPRGASRGGSS